jgi:hypothetical protein
MYGSFSVSVLGFHVRGSLMSPMVKTRAKGRKILPMVLGICPYVLLVR